MGLHEVRAARAASGGSSSGSSSTPVGTGGAEAFAAKQAERRAESIRQYGTSSVEYRLAKEKGQYESPEVQAAVASAEQKEGIKQKPETYMISGRQVTQEEYNRQQLEKSRGTDWQQQRVRTPTGERRSDVHATTEVTMISPAVFTSKQFDEAIIAEQKKRQEEPKKISFRERVYSEYIPKYTEKIGEEFGGKLIRGPARNVFKGTVGFGGLVAQTAVGGPRRVSKEIKEQLKEQIKTPEGRKEVYKETAVTTGLLLSPWVIKKVPSILKPTRAKISAEIKADTIGVEKEGVTDFLTEAQAKVTRKGWLGVETVKKGTIKLGGKTIRLDEVPIKITEKQPKGFEEVMQIATAPGEKALTRAKYKTRFGKKTTKGLIEDISTRQKDIILSVSRAKETGKKAIDVTKGRMRITKEVELPPTLTAISREQPSFIQLPPGYYTEAMGLGWRRPSYLAGIKSRARIFRPSRVEEFGDVGTRLKMERPTQPLPTEALKKLSKQITFPKPPRYEQVSRKVSNKLIPIVSPLKPLPYYQPIESYEPMYYQRQEFETGPLAFTMPTMKLGIKENVTPTLKFKTSTFGLQKTKQRTKTLQKESQVLGEMALGKQKQNIIQLVKPITIEQTGLKERTSLRQRSKQLLRQQMITTPPVTPVTRIPLGIPLFLFGKKQGKGIQLKRMKLPKQKRGYTPSFGSLLLGITSKQAPRKGRIYTGLGETRPIIIPGSFKRKRRK